MAEAPPGLHLTITQAARGALRQVLASQPAGSAILVYVADRRTPRPNLAIRKPHPHDHPTVVDGIPILVDEASRPYLSEAVIDHVSEPEPSFRIEGPNLLPAGGSGPTNPDGTGQSSAPAGSTSVPSSEGPKGREDALRAALKQIFDPEIPMNILDLGLIYGIEWPDEGNVRVRMTVTSPGCPVAGLLRDQVQAAAMALPGVRNVEVEIVWDPPWGPEKMSDFAKRQFGIA